MFKAVIFDVAGVLTEGLGAILLEAAAGIEGDLDQLAEALIPVSWVKATLTLRA